MMKKADVFFRVDRTLHTDVGEEQPRLKKWGRP